MAPKTTLTRTLLFGVGVFLSLFSFAQKEAKSYEKGLESLGEHRYPLALGYFKETAAIDPKYQDLEYKMEIATLLSPEGDDKSLTKILSFESSYGSSDDHYYYWLGQIYTRRYQISEAVSAFEKFHQKIAYAGNAEEESLEMVEHSTQLKEFFNNPDNYEIHQLESPVNSSSSELTPVYFEGENELLFASDRKGSGEMPFAIYYTKSGPNGWEPIQEVKNLGTFTRKNANIEVVNDDGKLFLFREENGGDLFYSQPSGSSWTTPVEFDARISNNHLASHFFINEHEDRIIFASDEDTDGLDIYESFRDPVNGKWSKPAPFSTSINSDYNEDSPYLSPDEKTLYFSSNRPGGIGGYDIYVSYYDPSSFSWSEPENMGWPINSPNDELHFKMNDNQTSGYFVSDRLHSKGGFDIYFFWEVQKVKIEGRIYDETRGTALTNAEIRFRPYQYLDEYFSSPIDQTGRYSTRIIGDETFKVEIIQNGKILMEEKFEIHDTSGEPTTHVKDFSVK